MVSEINSIMQLVGRDHVLATRSCGRYGIDIVKKDGSKSAFFFSAPIRNAAYSYICRTFKKEEQSYVFVGSSAKVKISSNALHLIGSRGKVELNWERPQSFVLARDEGFLRSQDLLITPTSNGVMVKQLCRGEATYSLQTSLKPLLSERINSKSFACMRAKFEPHFTMNTLYAESVFTHRMIPAKMQAKRLKEGEYEVQVSSCEQDIQRIVWEINLYEKKLIQDTTVESAHPRENNAFGASAFIGKTEELGLQFLYSRFDFSQIDRKHQQGMEHVLLHIPYYALGNDLKISAPFRRFCSFGSNWGNKMPFEDYAVPVTRSAGYFTLDISSHVINKYGGVMPNTGIVISPRYKEGVTVLATGDNYATPQIIEIQYRKRKDNE